MSGRFPTTYIALAQNASDGDMALYGALDWTVEAASPAAAAAEVRRRCGYTGSLAVVPAVHFHEFRREEDA